MFTDIAGFSTLSEQMPASETAEILNQYFSILVACIEAEDGTVDKYIEDSVMAFWEPDAAGDNVDRALQAARQIRTQVTQDNERRRRNGRVAPAVRVGIHTAPALVGNIGAPGRVNYTLVGDTVNVAAMDVNLDPFIDLVHKLGHQRQTSPVVSIGRWILPGN